MQKELCDLTKAEILNLNPEDFSEREILDDVII